MNFSFDLEYGCECVPDKQQKNYYFGDNFSGVDCGPHTTFLSGRGPFVKLYFGEIESPLDKRETEICGYGDFHGSWCAPPNDGDEEGIFYDQTI